jgi:hypothetical protein
MRDPHVETLRYQLETSPNFEFKNAPALEHETGSFKLRLDNGELIVRLTGHYAEEAGARLEVEPFLHAWELDYWLARGRREAWFEFIEATLVDRDPPPPPPPGTPRTLEVAVAPGKFSISAATATLSVAASQYPHPPSMTITADVMSMWQRYEGYLAGREPLPGMANFCLTLVERMAGNRTRAAARLGIAKIVLKELGRLVSDVGDHATGRKAIAHPRPHTAAETNWMEHAVLALIRRVAESAADPTVARRQLSMTDLPLLPT